MENQTVTHQNVGQRYRLVIERAASTKGVLGYKIEVNSDSANDALSDIRNLKVLVEEMTPIKEI
jgi:hypothetical protein